MGILDEKNIDKIYHWVDRPINKAMSVTLLFFCFYYILPPSFYETNDDPFFRFMLSGEYLNSIRSPFVVHINYILSSAYVLLYEKFSNVEWYGISQLLFLFFGFLYLSYILFLKEHDRFMFFVVMIIMFFLSFPFFISMQFTKTSFYLSISGLLGIAFSLKSNKIKYNLLVMFWGALLMSLGFMLRKDSFLLAVLMAFPVVLVEIRESRQSFSRRNAKLVAAIVMAFCTYYVVDRVNYQGNDRNYKAIINSVGLLNNYDYDYELNKKFFADVGYTENDFLFLNKWGYVDSGKFTDKKLSYLANNAIMTPNISQAIKNIVNVDVRPYVFMSLFVCMLLILAREKNVFGLSCLLSISLLILVYLLSKGRLPTRVIYCYFLGLPLVIFFITKGRGFSAVLPVILLIGCIYPSYLLAEKYKSTNSIYASYRDAMAYTSVLFKTGDHNLIAWDGLFPFISVKPFSRDREFSGNVIWLSAMNQSSTQKKLLGNNQLSDLWGDIIGKSKFLILLDYEKKRMLRVYYQENYGKIVDFVELWPGKPFYLIVEI